MDAKTTTKSRRCVSKEAKRLPTEEAARLGREMYEQEIRHLVEADHAGEIVALDVDSGIWGIGEDTMDARERLRAKRPEAVNVMFERVGYLAVHSFGGGNPRRTDWRSCRGMAGQDKSTPMSRTASRS